MDSNKSTTNQIRALVSHLSVIRKWDTFLCGDETKNRQCYLEAKCPFAWWVGQVFPSTKRYISCNGSHFGGTTGKALNRFGTRQTDGSTARISVTIKPEPWRIKSTPGVITFKLLVNLFHLLIPLLSGTSSVPQVHMWGIYFRRWWCRMRGRHILWDNSTERMTLWDKKVDA